MASPKVEDATEPPLTEETWESVETDEETE